MSEATPMYPNRLRERRESRALTRDGLASLCRRLADEDPARYRSLSVTTIRNVELGLVRPLMKTAASVARVLETDIESLFPAGVDDPRRNPGGNTRVEGKKS